MALNRTKISNLIISQPQSLFEVFNYLFDLPSPGIILNHINSRQMEVRTNQINGFFPLLFHDHDSDLSDFLDLSDEPGNGESFGLPIDEQRDLSIRGGQGEQGGHFCLFPMDPEDRIGFEL